MLEIKKKCSLNITLLNVLPYDCDYKTIMKSQKNGHGNAQIAKIFCDL